MSKQSPLIQYTKKGPPYIKTGGNHHDDRSNDYAISNSPSIASERCSVRGCSNTFATQPPKIFVPFPSQPSKRSRWLKVIGLDPSHPPSHKLFCCEDHFDLKRDVMHLSTLRSVNSGIVPNLLKDSVVPHRLTNSDSSTAPRANSSAGGDRTPPDEEMKVFITRSGNFEDSDPLSTSSSEQTVQEEPVPVSSPKIWVRSPHELMITSTSSLSELPNACTRPPESEGMRRTSVIHHKPQVSSPVVVPTSVIRTNPHSPKTSTPVTSQGNGEGPKIVDGEPKYQECAVRGCPVNRRTFPSIGLVCVPIADSVRKEWYKVIGRPYSKKSVRENIFVCTTHFRDDELETIKSVGRTHAHEGFQKRVRHGVIPTLNLIPPTTTGEVRTTQPPSGVVPANLPLRVPDLTPHSPSALMATPIKTEVRGTAEPLVPNSHDARQKAAQKSVDPNQSSGCDRRVENREKPLIPVQPRFQKYVAKTMPRYPECGHKTEEYQCSSLSAVDCSSFYSVFYSLDSRNDQNEFIFCHTEMVSSSSPELEQPVFKFFIDQKKSQGTMKRVHVCAQAFSTCLSFEITALISLVTRHFDTILSKSISKTSVVLKPVKIEKGIDGDGEEDDLMIYESVPPTVEIEDSPDEDVSVENRERYLEQAAGSDVDRPLTVEEELRQTVRNVVDCGRPSGYEDPSEHVDAGHDVPKTEPGTFETVHICNRCLAQFTSKDGFDEHGQIDSCNQFSGKFFKCNLCGRTLSTLQDLKVHTNVFHKYVCPKCNDTFRYRRYLEDHIIICAGTNRLTGEMERLIKRTKVMHREIADTRKRERSAKETSSSVSQKILEAECSVVLENMKIPASAKRSYNLNELTDASKGQPEEIPRLKIKVSPPTRRRRTRSSSIDVAEDPRRSPSLEVESEEDVDVESTTCSTVDDENHTKKRPKRKLSTSSDEEVIKKHPKRGCRGNTSFTVQNIAPPTRELRARKPISLAEHSSESDSDQIPELAGSGGESDVDPDFDPSMLEPQKGRKRRRRVEIDSEDTSESETERSKSRSSTASSYKFNDDGNMKCGQCGASFAGISGLRAHHRLSEKCGKFPPGTIFKCDDCKKMFMTQTMLDEHRSVAKLCRGAFRTPTPVDVDLLSCFHCDSSFSSLFNLRFHLKTSKDCLASARLRGEADEISSMDDAMSRASSDASERKQPHNVATGSHVCKCCKVVFNSNLGLGLHLKRSQKCIEDNPDVDLPGVVDKNSVDGSFSSTKMIADQEGKSFLMRGIKRTDLRDSHEDVVFVCVKCYSSFSSVWGLRTHERNSKDCKPDRPYEIPVPIPKEQAEKQKSEFLAKRKKEGKQPSESSPTSPASLGCKESEKPPQKPGFLMVYTQESQDEDGKFKCKSCSALFTSVWGLRTHHRISDTCMDKNPPRFPRIYQRNQLILSEAAAKSIAKGENICPNCSAKFSTSWGLRTHLRTSTLCSESETNIKSDSKLSKEGQILTCSKCEMVFLQLKQLRDHFKYSRDCLPEDVTIAKNGRVQPGAGCFLCPQCPKTFKLPFSLEQHFIEHAPQKEDWPCHLCTKDFADQFTMHRHFHREHLGKWFCIMCETKSLLTSFKEFYGHIFDHHVKDPDNAAKYFKCPTCFKSFISKFSYDFHMNTCKKMAEQVFQCASCHKVFNKKIHITNHMKYAHTGVVIDKRYKFKCPKCPRKFLSKKEYLQKHEKESCILEEMPCEICGEMYTGFEKLKMHLEIAHKKRSELQSGKKSPLPGRRTPEPGRRTPEPGRRTLEPGRWTPEPGRRTLEPGRASELGRASVIDIASSSSSPAPSSIMAPVQESPASPDSLISVTSVKIEPSSP